MTDGKASLQVGSLFRTKCLGAGYSWNRSKARSSAIKLSERPRARAVVSQKVSTRVKTKQKSYKGRTAAKRKGRPSRAVASAKALAALQIDPASVDPRAVLQSIAADTSAPATARVGACRALLAKPEEAEPEDAAADAVTKLALRLLGAKR